MKLLFSIAFTLLATAIVTAKEPVYKTPLSKYSKEWDNPKYQQCNTAKFARYLSADEKEIIFVLNMARINPQLFRKTILTKARVIVGVDTSSVVYFKSLDSTMAVLKPLPLVIPDSLCSVSARRHAEGCGQKNYTGHVRQTPESRKATNFSGECCHYGSSSPVYIVLSLLVDENVESLGHRRICFGQYKKLGTGIAPHIGYGNAAVLDFKY